MLSEHIVNCIIQPTMQSRAISAVIVRIASIWVILLCLALKRLTLQTIGLIVCKTMPKTYNIELLLNYAMQGLYINYNDLRAQDSDKSSIC